VKRIVDLLEVPVLPADWIARRPRHLNDAIEILVRHCVDGSPKESEFVANHCRFTFVRKLMPTVGYWISKNWWTGELSDYLEARGVVMADDAAELILRGTHDRLTCGSYSEAGLVEETKDYWRGLGVPDGIPKLV